MHKQKILLAMSGGVDSSTAAYVLQQQGYEVVGVTMRLFDRPGEGATGCASASCHARQHYQDARKVAANFGIRHYVVNYQADFHERVITPFVETYLAGMTPSPCVLCNSLVKFCKLRRFARCLGIPQIATGHYASVQYDDITQRHLLLKGSDERKDQSYFLFDLAQEQLREIVFPLGGMAKREIRQLAQELRLPVAEKGESQEICFIPDGDYPGFIDRVKGTPPGSGPEGELVLKDGTVVGHHGGIHHFTIGQRRGLGSALGFPAYVTAIRPERHQVVLGCKEDLLARRFLAGRCNWIAIPSLEGAIEASVKIRSRAAAGAAVIRPHGQDSVLVEFAEPQSAITPGQAAVFYWDDVVVGGGWIYQVDHETA